MHPHPHTHTHLTRTVAHALIQSTAQQTTEAPTHTDTHTHTVRLISICPCLQTARLRCCASSYLHITEAVDISFGAQRIQTPATPAPQLRALPSTPLLRRQPHAIAQPQYANAPVVVQLYLALLQQHGPSQPSILNAHQIATLRCVRFERITPSCELVW